MVPLPTPPTDNVYKFLTIGGILLFVVSFVAFNAFWAKQEQTLGAIQLQFALDTSEVRWLGEQSARSSATFDSLAARVRSIDTTRRATLAELQLLAVALRESALNAASQDSILKALRAAQHRLSETEARVHVAQLEINRHAPIDQALITLMVIGTAIAAVGLWLWYDRVQRYQDAALRRESVGAQSARADPGSAEQASAARGPKE